MDVFKAPLRQIDPANWNDEGPTSVNFRPLPKDHGQLSVDDGDRVSPEDSYDRAVKNEMRTAGVMSICPEVLGSFGLAPYSAPVGSPPLKIENPDHSMIPFPEGNGACKNIGQRLKAAAQWLHGPFRNEETSEESDPVTSG